MADQVVLLRAGRIEQDAPPAELYARPATVFAARFIGTPPMNIIAAPGRPDLKLGVRPEHVRIVERGGVEAVVQSVEYLGADTVVTCATSAGGTLGDTLAARVPGRFEARPRDADCASAGRPATATTSITRPAASARRHRSRSRLIDSKETRNEQSTSRIAPRGAGRRRGRAGRGAEGDRDQLLLPGRRRRPGDEDDRPDGGRLRQGESRHQGQPGLLGHLPGEHRQGAHRDQERQAAAARRAALDRHVLADRRGRDRADRRPRQERRRPQVARRLLQDLHAEQPHRRQDLGRPVPALDDRPLLEQGRLQGGRARPREGPGDLGPDGRVREEADQDTTPAATSPSGA